MRELKDEELEFVTGGSLPANSLNGLFLPIDSRPGMVGAVAASMGELANLDIKSHIESELLSS